MKGIKEEKRILKNFFGQKERKYEGIEKAIKMKPEEIIEEVKKSGLRGRGGAGFPTGIKWEFLRKDIKPRFLICNADEGEPGTFKDRELLDKAPHLLIEGMMIAMYAIGADKGFIYLRKEYNYLKEKIYFEINEAKKFFNFDIKIFEGAGAYICGEETALLESMEGKRGEPRLKPPYPVSYGLLGYPTIINNVETLCNIPIIVKNGWEWFKKIGTEKSPGTKLFSVSGSVRKPGVYEFEMGKITLRELIYDICGAEKVIGVFPGGISTPPLKEDELDVNLDFESLFEKGSSIGSGGVIVFDDNIPLIKILRKTAEFFKNESCGKCTPCREGTLWLWKILKNIEDKKNKEEGLDFALSICEKIKGKCFCPLGETCAITCEIFIKKFKDKIKEEI
jgi:NADH-quinone oxidoreductase subunit F